MMEMKSKIIIQGIILLFLISFSLSTSADDTYSINYNSYLDLEYDLSPINQPLNLSVSYSIPITIHFWTNIPEYYKQFESRLLYRFLYDTTIKPMKKISIEVNNSPSWANIYFSMPDMLVDIPYDSDGRMSIETILIILLKEDAPHVPYTIDIFVSTDSLKRLNGFSYEESIQFIPSYIPSMETSIENPTRPIDRHNKTIVPIEITNNGNHKSIIEPSLIYNDKSHLNINISPARVEFNVDEKDIFNLSVELDSSYGFFDDINFYESVEIFFNCEKYPPDISYDSIQETEYLVFAYIQNDFGDFLNSYLASIIILIFIICIIVILIRRRRLKQK
jgi:hypothetical protein